MSALRLLPELEDALRSLPGVQAVSIVTTGDAVPTEVHVLASPGKPAKQIVRDVQSLAMASFDQVINHKIISVVQIGEAPVIDLDAVRTVESLAETEPAHRPIMASVSMTTTGHESTATVSLKVGTEMHSGSATGSAAQSQRARITAMATLDALGELLGMGCEVESGQVVVADAHEVALVVLSLAVPRVGLQLLTGSAVVRTDPIDAVARAVLSALNRQLAG